MSEPPPQISIVLTSYNYARFLPRAIASAQAQQLPSLEIVIVDNASTDKSWELIETEASHDRRIRAFRNEANVGLIENHNRGLASARGERVLFLSADDYLLPGHLERVCAVHQRHPEVDVVFASYFKVDEDDRLLGHFGHVGHLRGSYYGGRNEFADLLTHDCYACLPTSLLRREYVLAAGGFDPAINAFDYDVYLRMAREGYVMAFLDEPGVCIRVHSAAASGEERYVATGKQLLEHLYLMERHLTDEAQPLIAGREHGLARLLGAKVNNLHAYPEVAAQVMPTAQPRIDKLTAHLNASLAKTSGTPLPAQPRVSVIVPCGDDLQSVLDLLSMLQTQEYPNFEVIVVCDTTVDVRPVVCDRTGALSIKLLRHTAPRPFAAACNDAIRLADGDILVYGESGATWPAHHLASIVKHFAAQYIDAVVVRVDVALSRDNRVVTNSVGFLGATLAQTSGLVGEAVPLCALAHRRSAVDRLGGFDERLPYLCEFEFVRRILGTGTVGFDDTNAVSLRRQLDTPHPALQDPNGYLNTLRSIYTSRPMSAPLQLQVNAHLTRLQAAIPQAVATADVGGLLGFWAIVRGTESTTPQSVQRSDRPRVLMIDDRVPYRELGRGYPRARDIIEILRESTHVTFYPLLTPVDEPPLQSGIPNIRILYGYGTAMLAPTLDELLSETDILWVSRPHNMERVRKALGGTIPSNRRWKLVYDAEAIYAHRDITKAALSGKPLDAVTQTELIARETALLHGCDLIFAVSHRDREAIAESCGCPVEVLSFCLSASPTSTPFAQREGLLFVGTIEPGSPNEDALGWFSAEVLPLLRKYDPGIPIRHAGVMTSRVLQAEVGSAVEFLGVVTDLREEYERSRVFIAPTRYAAGLPQKVYEAAANGVPIVATSLIAEQLGWTNGRQLLVADTPQEWLGAIVRVYEDAHTWELLREGALEAVRREVSPQAFAARLHEVVRIGECGRP
ncbi:MAG: glycosyltransferase [Vulcanimicrobiaceae bacterium]